MIMPSALDTTEANLRGNSSKKHKTTTKALVYFPDEVFQHIKAYMLDPYKADREAHAKVWQNIRVIRYVFITYEDEFTETREGQYFVYITGGKCGTPDASIPTMCFLGPEPDEWDNVSEIVEYDYEDEQYE